MRAAVVEQRPLLRSTDQPSRNGPGLDHSVLIELAELRYRLLDDTPTDAHAAHKPPVAMNLPVLLANRIAQVHAPSEPIGRQRKYPRSALHAQIGSARMLTH